MNRLDVARFKALPVLGILRGIRPAELEPVLESVEEAGLRTVEITMNTPGAAALIRRAVAWAGKRLAVGAGTVVDKPGLRSALDAGAGFIVMPVLVPDVVAYCVKHRIPVFPGALTPQEIFAAWRAGATMVKVFPASCFGPEYFGEIKGPFDDIELLACGGVTPQNLGAYFARGADAVSFGGSVFRKDWLARKEFFKIGRAVRAYVRAFEACPSGLPGEIV